MPAVVVVGAQWGDEGKGKIVDVLSKDADTIVRFSGGANAGHTLVVGGEKIILHLIPSGVLHPGKRCALGDGMVIDLATLLEEVQALRERGLLREKDALRISHRAHLILPYHKALDEAREATASAIGTTKRGIGPAYEDKIGRRGVRVGDLLRPSVLRERLRESTAEANARLARMNGPSFNADEIAAATERLAQPLLPYIADVSRELDQALEQGQCVLLEGAQGTLLDVDHGTYPFVTATTTTAGGACTGAGIGPTAVQAVTGVTKAYTTRVGNGPFPTELAAEAADKLRRAGGEYGATTGRPRRCGWLDLAALRLVRRLNGLSGLCLTKLDVLCGSGPVQVCTGYQLGTRVLDEMPVDLADLAQSQPIYETFEGFDQAIGEARSWEDLPPSARLLCQAIVDAVDVPIHMISVGASREQTIVLEHPFVSSST